MKEEEEGHDAFTVWVSKQQKIVSFQPADCFEELSFCSHEEKFAYVVELCEAGYRII